jgi:hypothetical protein
MMETGAKIDHAIKIASVDTRNPVSSFLSFLSPSLEPVSPFIFPNFNHGFRR